MFVVSGYQSLSWFVHIQLLLAVLPEGWGGVLLENLGSGVRPASQNLYPIYDQNLRFFLPYLWPDKKFDTRFMTLVHICLDLLQVDLE